MNNWHVYILRCADGTFYTGCCTDLKRRLEQHNGKRPGGARYTRSRRPVMLVFSLKCSSRSSAQGIEHSVKSLSHSEKATLAGLT